MKQVLARCVFALAAIIGTPPAASRTGSGSRTGLAGIASLRRRQESAAA